MKALMLILVFCFSVSAMAMTEVECSGRQDGADVRIDIQGRWNQSYFKTGTIYVKKDGVATTTRHNLNYRAPWGGFSRAEYNDGAVRIEVDLWPDQAPRWGRSYFGTAWIDSVSRFPMNLNCRYPYAQ